MPDLDLRKTLRRLGRSPGFTMAALATLALAIAANVAVFAVVHSVLLEPLPYPDADRLTRLRFGAPGIGVQDLSVSVPMYLHYRSEADVFEDVAAYDAINVNLTGTEGAERLPAAQVTDGFFGVLGLTPTPGRGFAPEDVGAGALPTAVISHGLWRRRFGADPGVVGGTIRLNGVATTVIGVAPADVALPSPETEVWLPLNIDPAALEFDEYYLDAIARLAPGVTLATAGREVEALRHELPEAYPGNFQWTTREDVGFTTGLETMKETVVGDVRAMLRVVLGGIGALLLIASANVANLFLVRAEGRNREMAVRSALGATPVRLMAAFLGEGLLIGAAGAVIGLYLAWVGLDAFLAWNPTELPRAGEIGIDGVVAAFGGLLGLATGAFVGLLPARRASRSDVASALKEGDRGATGRAGWTRNALVAAQVALAIVLLIGAGLLARSYAALRDVDPGFEPAPALTFRVSLPGSTYPTDVESSAFYAELVERIEGLPGVERAGAITWLPLAPGGTESGFHMADRPLDEGAVSPIVPERYVSAGYFEAMGIRLVEGRTLDRSDMENGRPVVVVSRDLAERFWPDESAIGKSIASSFDGPWFTVVGVVGSVRDVALQWPPTNLRYLPMRPPRDQTDRSSATNMSVVVRTAVPPTSLLPAIRDQVADLDPEVPVAGVETLQDIVTRASARVSFTALLIAFAALMSLLLGTIGVYGVVSYMVGQRTREIGVRMALGADRARVSRLVVARGLRMAALGATVGVPAAIGLGHLLGSLLFQVGPNDPATFIAVPIAVMGVAAAASWIPARRAAGVSPMTAIGSGEARRMRAR